MASNTGKDSEKPGSLSGAISDAADGVVCATKAAIDSGIEKTEKLAAKTVDVLSDGSKDITRVQARNKMSVPDDPTIDINPTSNFTKRALPAAATNEDAAAETTPLVAGGCSRHGDDEAQETHPESRVSGIVQQGPESSLRRHSSLLTGDLGNQDKESGGINVRLNPLRIMFDNLPISIIVFLIMFLIMLSYRYRNTIWMDGVVPLYLASIWTILGFFAGHILWPTKVAEAANRTDIDGGDTEEKVAAARSISARLSTQEGQPDLGECSDTERKRDAFRKLFDISAFIPSLGRSAGNPPRSTLSKPVLESLPNLSELAPSGIWTNLHITAHRAKAHWEQHVHDTPTTELMQRLLRYPDFRTKPCKHTVKEYSVGGKPDDMGAEQDTIMETETLGHVNTGNDRASVLQAEIEIDPVFKLRGIDVFRTNSPEERIWRQPILERNGLRDVPTFLVNLMLPTANLVVYFQMPEWIKRFEDIVEEEDDQEDTKALKRFLKGDDKYRNRRWKILPCLVDGPYIIQCMAPEKKEVTIAGGRVGASWHVYSESVDPKTGKKRAALLEVDCDLVSNPSVRKICNIVFGQVKNVVIDCAMIIEKPYLAETIEPAACLGLWRMDRIDMNQTAIAPEKDEKELLREASVIFDPDQSKAIQSLLAEEAGRMETVQGGYNSE